MMTSSAWASATIAIHVTPADLSDPSGARKLLVGLTFRVLRLETIWAEAAYRGKDLAG